MREILFRGKQVNNDEWVIGNLICLDVPKDIISDEEFDCYIGDSRGIYSFRVNPSTVGQYTGLTDKNGNKIFEGDIIKHFNDPLNPLCYDVYQIVFNKTRCMFEGRLHKSWAAELRPNLKYEIIGNIYDNPELIKQEANNGKL